MLTLADFCPINNWKVESSVRDHLYKGGMPRDLIDRTTGNVYWNSPRRVVRRNCLALTVITTDCSLPIRSGCFFQNCDRVSLPSKLYKAGSLD